MSQWKKVRIGDICKIVKGTTGIASAEPGQYPLVVTAEERKTCSTYQFDCEAVCIPLVSSSGHGKKSLKNVHYQSGKFALGTILCAVIPNNPQELDARFLHQYLQFYKDTILVPLMKGAANVSLSMKDIATVEIPLPPIENQRELSDKFITLQKNQKNLAAETEQQFEYIKLLRQNILQDAIEGKLTADWRKSHPVIKGNPDYDAEALFEKIQKGEVSPSLQPDKPSSATPSAGDTPATPPFEIPEGWKWIRLGEIINLLSGRDFEPSEYNDKQKGIPYITGASNFGENGIIINRWTESPKCIAKQGELLLVCKGSGYGALMYADFKEAHIARQIMAISTISPLFLLKYVEFILKSKIQYLKEHGKGLIPGIDRETVLNIQMPLPTLKEQEEIITKVENLLAKVTELETQIQERKTLSEKLAFGIIKENLEKS